jgi:hypothetical protein
MHNLLVLIVLKHFYNMAKIYSKKSLSSTAMKPEKEIVSFLLNYSKALHILKTDQRVFEINAN